MDAKRQPLGDSCLANTRITNIERVVLGASAQNLDGAVKLPVTSDQRINPASRSLGDQINGVLAERIAAISCFGVCLDLFLSAAADVAIAAMADIGHSIKAGHIQRLEEPDGMALTLGKDRDENVCPGRHLTAR